MKLEATAFRRYVVHLSMFFYFSKFQKVAIPQFNGSSVVYVELREQPAHEYEVSRTWLVRTFVV
jgi:hypothetical protein